MKDKPWYPIAYMFIVTFLFSMILIGLSRATKERVEANQQLNFEFAVLKSLPIPIEKDATSLDLHALYLEKIAPPNEKSAGAYVYQEGNTIRGYALPISGKGFWDTIYGVVGIASDKTTITGIYFYRQSETPGLGAEIAQEPFRKQFIGKILAKTGTAFQIKPVGSLVNASEVQAVTGATQTSTRLNKFLSQQLTEWRNAMSAI